MSSHVQTVVIGAGVVGLAIARKLSKFLGHEILILETNSIIGAGTSQSWQSRKTIEFISSNSKSSVLYIPS